MNAPHPTGEERRLAGRTVFVRQGTAGGDLPPAVLVHGLGGQSTNWTDFMAEMSTDLRTWAPDLPGFGWSPAPADSDYSVAADVAVVCALIDELFEQTGQQVHLFGNSMGGAVSVVAAASRPSRVATMTLISPALPDLRPRRDTMGVPLMAIPGVGARIYARLARVPAERQVDGMVALNYADAASFTETRREEAVKEVQRRLALPYSGEALSGSGALTPSFVRGSGAARTVVGCSSCPVPNAGVVRRARPFGRRPSCSSRSRAPAARAVRDAAIRGTRCPDGGSSTGGTLRPHHAEGT